MVSRLIGLLALAQPSSGDVVGCSSALGTARSTTTVFGGDGTSLVQPSSLAFNPANGEVFVTDHGSDSLVAINYSATTDVRYLRDRAKYHYMDKVSGISFDPLGQFATCQESLNNYEGQMLPNFFMGPTLYDSKLGLVNSKQESCLPGETCFLIHIDMLHEAPLCMGIAHDNGPAVTLGGRTYRNVYWTYDGGSSQLVRFDFESDHGPGSMDHSLASVRRYTGILLNRKADVSSGMVVDAATRQMFVSDTGANRVLVVDVDSGYFGYDAKPIFPVYSSPASVFNYSVWHGITYSLLGTVPEPSGLALTASVVYVGSYSTGSVYAFERSTGQLLQLQSVVAANTLGGIALDPMGALVYVDMAAKSIVRIDVTQACSSAAAASTCTNGAMDGDETGVDCGGASCPRCSLGAGCTGGTDCLSGQCNGTMCSPSHVHMQNSSFLWSYLDSEFYTNSFAHHLIHGDMGAASYLNPYPIMEPGFCASVGMTRTNFSTNAQGEAIIVGTPVNLTTPDCSAIDFDSLLLGGCWCHSCLPENPCEAGGTCVNYQSQGYTCDCPAGRSGDHCQFTTDSTGAATLTAWPWYMMPGGQSSTSGSGGDDDVSVVVWVVPASIFAVIVLFAGVYVATKGTGSPRTNDNTPAKPAPTHASEGGVPSNPPSPPESARVGTPPEEATGLSVGSFAPSKGLRRAWDA